MAEASATAVAAENPTGAMVKRPLASTTSSLVRGGSATTISAPPNNSGHTSCSRRR